MDQLARDMRAYVDFFLWDPWSMFHALRTHTRGAHDECVARCGPWPCTSYRTAEYAERMYRARRLAQAARADAPFRHAIRANATETTAPMRAVPRTPSPAAGNTGQLVKLHGKENQS